MQNQTKIQVLVVAPYESLADLFLTLIAKYPQFNTDIVIGDLAEGVKRTQEKLKTHTYDLIISRGGTSELIKKITHIPVVQVPITTSDVLMALKLTERYTEKFAVVGFPSITKYAYEIKELLQRDYQVITLQEVDELDTILENLKSQGITMILGDFITYNTARALGINSVLILSCEESIEITINQAITISETLAKTNQKQNLLKSILTSHHEYFAIFDTNNHLIEKNFPSELDETQILTYINTNLAAFYAGNAKFATQRINNNLLAFRSVNAHNFLIINIYVKDWNEKAKTYGVNLVSQSNNTPATTYHSTSASLGAVQYLLNSYKDTTKVVVLIGEESTGKIAAARTMHQNSRHQNKPYYLIDCYQLQSDALPIDTSLFDTPTSKGTSIIFDNFQDASPNIKKSILHYIKQTHKNKTDQFYLTLTTTNTETDALEDSQARLQEIATHFPFLTIEMPALRYRKQDLSNLITLYLSEYRETYAKPVTGFKNEALDRLIAYHWPGNLNQLKRVLEELFLQASSYYVTEKQVREILAKEERIFTNQAPKQTTPIIDLTQPLNDITRDIVEIVLKEENMNKTKTAERLAIGRSTLWRILKTPN